jgi:hypothetical protein
VDKIETVLEIREGGSEISLSVSGWGQFVGLCETCNEHFVSTNWWNFFDYMRK